MASVEGVAVDVAEPTGTTIVAELDPNPTIVVDEDDEGAEVTETAEDVSAAELTVSDAGTAEVSDEL